MHFFFLHGLSLEEHSGARFFFFFFNVVYYRPADRQAAINKPPVDKEIKIFRAAFACRTPACGCVYHHPRCVCVCVWNKRVSCLWIVSHTHPSAHIIWQIGTQKPLARDVSKVGCDKFRPGKFWCHRGPSLSIRQDKFEIWLLQEPWLIELKSHRAAPEIVTLQCFAGPSSILRLRPVYPSVLIHIIIHLCPSSSF